MRVAYVCADLGVPVYGSKGASIHVRELIRAFEALGHEVLVVTPRLGGRRPEGFSAPVLHVPAGEERGDLRALAYSRALPDRALRELEAFAPDLVYERLSLFGTAGATLALRLGVPFVLEVNAPLAHEQAVHRGLELCATARRLERTALRTADRVVVVSSALRQWAVDSGVDPRRVLVLPNGVDATRFAVPAPPGARTVGFVGTLKPWHDVATLIRAAACVRGARLLLVGDGPERHALEDLAGRTGVEVTFTGSVRHEEVPAALATMDVAVAPYAPSPDFYFSPLKLFEYLAAARPVVAAEIGEIAHCVRPGETGWLYRPGDADELARAIAEAIRSPALGASGREHVRAYHTWERNAQAVIDVARATRRVRLAS